jgi:hypothetical protein
MTEIDARRSPIIEHEEDDGEEPEEDQQLLERKDSVLSAPAGVGQVTKRAQSSARTHDLIPYIGVSQAKICKSPPNYLASPNCHNRVYICR